MKTEARLSFDTIRFDQDTTAHLVLSLTAPAVVSDETRPKLAIVVCVDTSSSMGGRKMEYAKLSIQKLIDHLKPDDYLGVVSFAAASKVEAPLTRLVAGKKDELRKQIAGLHACGNTNFSGGMLDAIEQLKNADLGGHYLHRIIMFTDGQANSGPAVAGPDIIRFFKANAPEYITASAFGYGQGVHDFDAGFLTDFAREARGNYAHVEDPDNALKAFGTELGGLISTYATNIRVNITPLAGHLVEKVLTDVDADEDPTGELTIKVPDLLAEETRHVVLAVKLAKQKSSGPRAVNVFNVKTFYEHFDTAGKKVTEAIDGKAKVRFVKDGEEQKRPTPEIDTIVGLAQLVRAQVDAERFASRGDFVRAANVMTEIADSFDARGNEGLAAMSQRISSRLGNANSYNASRGYLRGLSRGATRGMGGYYSAEVQSDLMQIGVVTSNSAQTSTADSFNTGVSAGGFVPTGAGTAVPAPANIPVVDIQAFQDQLAQASQDPDFAVVVSPVPSETDSADKSKDKSVSARKPVRQARSKKNW